MNAERVVTSVDAARKRERRQYRSSFDRHDDGDDGDVAESKQRYTPRDSDEHIPVSMLSGVDEMGSSVVDPMSMDPDELMAKLSEANGGGGGGRYRIRAIPEDVADSIGTCYNHRHPNTTLIHTSLSQGTRHGQGLVG